MSDPERGVTKCYYCRKVAALFALNDEQKILLIEFEGRDASKHPKYCARCLIRCDEKLAARKRKNQIKSKENINSENQITSGECNTNSYQNDFSLCPSQSQSDSYKSRDSSQSATSDGVPEEHVRSPSDLSIHLSPEKNKPNQQASPSNGSQSSDHASISNDSPSRKRPAESCDDSDNFSLDVYSPEKQPAKKNKSNEQSDDNQSPNSSHNEILPIKSNDPSSQLIVIDDDDVVTPPVFNNDNNRIVVAPPDDDGNDGDSSSSSSSNNSISSRRTPNVSHSDRRSNSSQSSSNRSQNGNISGSAPSQKHIRVRDPVPTRPYTNDEQQQMRDPNIRQEIVNYKRPIGA